MISQTVQPAVPQHKENPQVSDEVKDRAFISSFNESDYSDFLYLAPPLSAEFLPLETKATDKTAALKIKKASVRPTETFNTGTTPPPSSPIKEHQHQYFGATYLPSRPRTPTQEETQIEAERRERRPSFVEVTPVKVHDSHKDVHKEKRHSHSSHDSEPMNWWPENEATAQHEWVEQGEEEEDVIEEEVWSDAFYE